MGLKTILLWKQSTQVQFQDKLHILKITSNPRMSNMIKSVGSILSWIFIGQHVKIIS